MATYRYAESTSLIVNHITYITKHIVHTFLHECNLLIFVTIDISLLQ